MALVYAKPQTLRTIILILVSSALLLGSITFIAQTGGLQPLNNVLERIRHEQPTNCDCSNAPDAVIPKIFQKLPDRMQIPEANWDAELLTPNGGFLMVQGNEKPVGYGVSMFHQLHCLSMIRAKLLDVAMPAHHHHSQDEGPAGNMGERHWLHCLDYMAQAIVCAADDALEKPKSFTSKKGKKVLAIDGMGNVHQCRNATTLYEKVANSENQPVHPMHIGENNVFPRGQK